MTMDEEPEGQQAMDVRAPDPVHIEDDPEPGAEAEEPEDAQQPAEDNEVNWFYMCNQDSN